MTNLLLPIGLGLLGFVEPCSIGATLLFIRHAAARSDAQRLTAVLIFAASRALLIGALGAVAAVIGGVFAELQRWLWLILGGVYLVVGLAYVSGKSGALARRIGPSLTRLSGVRGSLGLGLLFGLNVPACAVPLLFVLFGTAAAAGTVLRGFSMLAVFGLALSLPLVVAVAIPKTRRWLERLALVSRRFVVVTGLVLMALGLWSLYFALTFRMEEWLL